jgi:hypothetical protein
MHTEPRLISLATFGLLLVSMPATRFVTVGSHIRPSRGAPAACTLLTAVLGKAAVAKLP